MIQIQLAKIREAGERGVAIHYIEGNHDFLLAKALAGIPGLQLHDSSVSLTLERPRYWIRLGAGRLRARGLQRARTSQPERRTSSVASRTLEPRLAGMRIGVVVPMAVSDGPGPRPLESSPGRYSRWRTPLRGSHAKKPLRRSPA